MWFLLVFAIAVLLAALFSALAERSVLSTAVLLLATGFLCGPGWLGIIQLEPDGLLVEKFAELALFAVLFVEGMDLRVGCLRRHWKLPARALVIGMPLTIVVIAALAHYLSGLTWIESLLLGAILSPTDPVFAAQFVSQPQVPQRLKDFLNVESGLNDGLALPAVFLFLAIAKNTHGDWLDDLGSLAGGIALGIVIPAMTLAVTQLRAFSVAGVYRPIYGLAMAMLLYAVTSLTHANEFLAAFVAGVYVATFGPKVKEAFVPLGDPIAELLKLAAILSFGALLSPHYFYELSWQDYAFALATLLLVRPLAVGVSLIGSGLSAGETAAGLWFGPKGFASVLYALWALNSGGAAMNTVFGLAALSVALSMLAHSSTDTLVARMFTGSSKQTLTAFSNDS
jgi:NhaP-type Na+/H+ or K+/H+ antiporter